MPERKPFEDAWLLLDAHATANEVEAKNYRRKGRDEDADDLEREAKSYRAAIAFLEAGQKVDKSIEEMYDEVNKDERYHYPPANVEINAPLALIQCEMDGRMHVLKRLRALLAALPKGD